MLESVIADKYRWKDYKHPIILSQFRFIYVKRWCEYYRNRSKVLFLVWRAIYQRMETKYNMDFPAKVIVGKGLRIEHMGGSSNKSKCNFRRKYHTIKRRFDWFTKQRK